jgi:hypothetical protein
MFFFYPLGLLSGRSTVSIAVVTNELALFYRLESCARPLTSVGYPGGSINDLDMDFLRCQYSCYAIT